MKIGLIGYGNMGQMIEKMALSQGHEIVAKITSKSWQMDALAKADVCMEFTNPDSVLGNVQKLAELKKQIIIGTTGWHDKLDIIRAIVNDHQVGALYAPNFSIGIYLTLEILAYASRLINQFEEYDAAGIDYHHRNKKDAPSGTAHAIAAAIEANMSRIDKFPFSSVRCGSIPGTHEIIFDSPCDTLTISHTARNRESFATGALYAAKWLQGKAGLYTFHDCMNETIEEKAL